MTIKKDKGNLGEDLVCKYLEDLGHEILFRNYFVRGSELDIVSRKGKDLFFVEVKTRQNSKDLVYSEIISHKKNKSIKLGIKMLLSKEKLLYESCFFCFALVLFEGKDYEIKFFTEE